jgi:DNA-binding SARP family transcriptional activator
MDPKSGTDKDRQPDAAAIADLIQRSLDLEHAGQMSAALQTGQTALAQARLLADAELSALALCCLARAHFHLGHYDETRRLAEEALTCASARGLGRIRAWILLGACAAETNDLDGAEAYFRQAIDLSRETGSHTDLYLALHDLAGGVYWPRGQFALTVETEADAIRIAQAHGHRSHQYSWDIIALAHLTTGQYRQAQAALEQMAAITDPQSLAEGYYCCLMGHLTQSTGDPAAAQAYYAQARTIAESVGEPGLNIEVRMGLSRLARLAGQPAEARAWAQAAVGIAANVGYRHLEGKSRIESACSAWENGDPAAAEAELRVAIAMLTPLRLAYDLTHAELLLAALLYQQQRPEAESAWRAAATHLVQHDYAFLAGRERQLAYPLIAAYSSSSDTELAGLCAALLARVQQTPPPELAIATLGGLQVRVGVRSLDPKALRQRRAGELLGLLLVSPQHSLTSEQVAEALCPEKAPAAAQDFYHHAVSTLRRLLEPDLPDRRFPSRYLDVDEERVTLHLPPDSRIDYLAFEAHCRRQEWAAALALYQGEFLPEYRYADWAALHRQRLTEAYEAALLGAAEQRLAAGDRGAALELARRLLALNPWHEAAAGVGMRAAGQLNDRASVLRIYRNLEKSLQAELGVAPQKALQDLLRTLTKN